MAEGREKATFKDPSEKKTDRDQDRPKFLTQKCVSSSRSSLSLFI